ncbi:unnamed protein product, partial [Rhizoctonia solani]
MVHDPQSRDQGVAPSSLLSHIHHFLLTIMDQARQPNFLRIREALAVLGKEVLLVGNLLHANPQPMVLQLGGRVDQSSKRINRGSRRVNRRLNLINHPITQRGRLTRMNQRLNRMEERLDRMGERLDQLEARITESEEGLNARSRIEIARSLNYAASGDPAILYPPPLPTGNMPGANFPATIADLKALTREELLNLIMEYQIVNENEIPVLLGDRRRMLARHLGAYYSCIIPKRCRLKGVARLCLGNKVFRNICSF